MGRSMVGGLGKAAIVFACAATVIGLGAVPVHAYEVRGLVQVTASSAWSSFDTKTISAVCPRGTSVIGGGGAAYNTTNDFGLIITEAYPDPAGNRFTVVAWEDQMRTANSWVAVAHAMCAPPVPGLQYVSTPWHSDIDGTWAICPAGKKVIGMGGQVVGGSGEMALAGIFPAMPSQTRAETWVTEDPDGFNGSYQVRSTAVCASPIAGLEYVVTSKVVPGAGGSAAFCPSGKVVISPGVRLASGGAAIWHGEAFFSQLGVKDGNEARAYAEEYMGEDMPVTLQVIAICA